MRKKLIVGNWKMNKLSNDAQLLFDQLHSSADEFNDVTVVLAPPALYLAGFAQTPDSKLYVGAQDVSAHSKEGAYTGEFSAAMLKSVGAHYAIVGHSERRTYHQENDALVSKKIHACVEAGIIPIYCCGESLEERESGNYVEVVQKQIEVATSGFDATDLQTLVIAYEPVWAIGTGKSASHEQAQEMHSEIRAFLKAKFGDDLANKTRILYGGSCNPTNAKAILSQKDVDGGLIGGAALNAENFLAIIRAA